jgi:1-acyl-sn-glycerol-3-phosphate acyltransferase
MPAYILLSRLSSDAEKNIIEDEKYLFNIRHVLEQWEANVIADYHLLGIYNHCTIFEVSDNFRAQQAVLNIEITHSPDTLLLPGIDLKLFQDLIKKEIRTEGPHEWQISWWAKLLRLSLRWRQYSKWMWRYCKPFTATGKEHFKGIEGPCIVVGNHTSHFDSLALYHGLPQRIKYNIYFGAAADRWFLKDGGGRKELELQPWFNSLAIGSFPIRRGGGSATLDYSKWLLDQGANLAIFPEGTRSTGRNMARFKHGVALLALEKKVPIVPCYLTGLKELRPKGTREIFPGPASVNYQPPIYLPEDIDVPGATKMIHDSLSTIHERVHVHGSEAARHDWQAG